MKVISRITYLSRNTRTLRLVIPKVIVTKLNLKAGDYILWRFSEDTKVLTLYPFNPEKIEKMKEKGE